MIYSEKIEFGNLYLIPSKNGLNRPSEVRGKGNPMINMGEIFAHDRIRNVQMELVKLNEKEKISYNIEPLDLIFARQSIVAEGAGKCSIVLEVPELTCFESHIIRVRLDQEKANPLFYYYFFQSEFGKAFLSTIRQQGVQAGIRGSDLKKLKIPYPNPSAQNKIASILSAYDDLIENNLQRIKLLEELAQITYEEWFVRFRIDGEDLTIDGETGLPVGWREGTISEISYVNKKTLSIKNAPVSIRYIDISSTGSGCFEEPDEIPFEEAPGRARRVLTHGDSIFSTVRPNRKIFAQILNPKKDLIASTGFAVLTPKVSNYHSFLYTKISNQSFIDNATSVAGGAAYPAISPNDFKKLKIIIPPEDLIARFSEFANPLMELKSNLFNQNHLLKEARDILLPRLMTGMIDVSEMEEEMAMAAENGVQYRKEKN